MPPQFATFRVLLQVVVAGGGLAGASCAWQLAERGASVTLVEPRALLGATSQCSRPTRPPPKKIKPSGFPKTNQEWSSPQKPT